MLVVLLKNLLSDLLARASLAAPPSLLGPLGVRRSCGQLAGFSGVGFPEGARLARAHASDVGCQVPRADADRSLISLLFERARPVLHTDSEDVGENLIERNAVRFDWLVLQRRLDLIQFLNKVLYEAVTSCLLCDPS